MLETARGGILREGLGFDRCDVAVVTNIGEGDHLGLSDIDTLETLAKVKRCIVDVVPPDRVRRAQRRRSAGGGMAGHCPGAVVFFARDRRPSGDGPRTAARAAGRSSSATATIVIWPKGTARKSLIVAGSRAARRTAARSASRWRTPWRPIAAAWALGVPLDVIRARVESFAADIDKVPGRFNVLEIDGATVVVDYGHNRSALLAVIEAIDKFPHQKRARSSTRPPATAATATSSARARCSGEAFDHVILYEDHYLRGRADGEIIGLFRKGLASATRTKTDRGYPRRDSPPSRPA